MGCSALYEAEFAQMFELVEEGAFSEQANFEIPDIYQGSILHFFEGKTPFLAFNTEGFSLISLR